MAGGGASRPLAPPLALLLCSASAALAAPRPLGRALRTPLCLPPSPLSSRCLSPLAALSHPPADAHERAVERHATHLAQLRDAAYAALTQLKPTTAQAIATERQSLLSGGERPLLYAAILTAAAWTRWRHAIGLMGTLLLFVGTRGVLALLLRPEDLSPLDDAALLSFIRGGMRRSGEAIVLGSGAAALGLSAATLCLALGVSGAMSAMITVLQRRRSRLATETVEVLEVEEEEEAEEHEHASAAPRSAIESSSWIPWRRTIKRSQGDSHIEVMAMTATPVTADVGVHSIPHVRNGEVAQPMQNSTLAVATAPDNATAVAVGHASTASARDTTNITASAFAAERARTASLARLTAWQSATLLALAASASLWAAEAAFYVCTALLQRLRLRLLALAVLASEAWARYMPAAQQRAQDWLPKSRAELSERVNYQLNLWGLQAEQAMTSAWSGYLRRRQVWLTASKRAGSSVAPSSLQSWFDLRVAGLNQAWVGWQVQSAKSASKAPRKADGSPASAKKQPTKKQPAREGLNANVAPKHSTSKQPIKHVNSKAHPPAVNDEDNNWLQQWRSTWSNRVAGLFNQNATSHASDNPAQHATDESK